jgi:L-amino acid N-acyltransferase YncA
MVILQPLLPKDWEAVKQIYEQGIATGNATFETRAPDWNQWDKAHVPKPRLAAWESAVLVGWAALTPVSDRCVYGGVAEVSVYVAAGARGRGIGKQLLQGLIRASEEMNFWTLQAGIFPENKASVSMHLDAGFRILGKRERIGKMNGLWRDTLLLERRSGLVGLD